MAQVANDWQPVDVAPEDDWQPVVTVPRLSPDTSSDIQNGNQFAFSAIESGFAQVAKPAFEPIMRAFGQGFTEGFGPERLGISPDNVKLLSKAGIFESEGAASYANPLKAFNELLLETVVRTPEILLRGSSGLFRGAQAAVVAAGFPRDIAALPEAFLGSPHPLGIPTPRVLPEPLRLAPEEGAYGRLQDDIGGHHEARPLTLADARDLGVIGPPKPSIIEGTPAEAAQRATRSMGAEGRPEAITAPVEAAATDKAGNIRLDLINTHEDAKNVIRLAAEENGEFMPARRGEIPLAQIDALSQVTGIPPEEMQFRGMGRLMRNDNEVRLAIQAMIQSAEDTSAAMKKAALTDAPEDLIEFQRLRMRHSVLQEQVAGLTAEWGRTGLEFQKFKDQARDAKGLGDFLANKGETLDDLRNMARAGSELDPRTQLPKFLNDMRKPGAWDKFVWYWTNSLISGPFTHAKYVLANSAFAAYEATLVTPIAAALGKARSLLGETDADRAYFGETTSRLWGLVAGAPDALVASWKAAKSGLQTALPGQIAQGIIPSQNRNPVIQQRPIGGAVGTAVGLPARMATSIHTFFNFLGYRAEIEAQAYRAAAKEGLSPADDLFWQRHAEIATSPPVEMMNDAIKNGAHLTFITELGPKGRAFQQWVNSFPPAKLIMPFLHIPLNLLKATIENTPLAYFDGEMRDALLGRKGTIEQDTARARVVAGGALMAWVANGALNDKFTGDGPREPKERELWLLTHEPNSVRIGDHWVSYARFGPVGDLMSLGANTAEIVPHLQPDSEELTKVTAMAVHAASRMLVDEVGMQGLSNLVEAMNSPERKGARYIASFASTLLPYGSLLRQTASMMDPQMREAKDVIDGIKSSIPVVRQSLYPVRDWTGAPRANSAFEEGSILHKQRVNTDPVDLEMQTLDLRPAPPQNRIGGVKLTRSLYDEYQTTAGALTRTALEQLVGSQGWYDLPPILRQETFKGTIKTSREFAAAILQAKYPRLIDQGIANHVSRLTGQKPTRLQE